MFRRKKEKEFEIKNVYIDDTNDLTMWEVVNRIKNKNFVFTYKEAINIGIIFNDVKYKFNKKNDLQSFTIGIFNGFVFKVEN